jgi:hypothetical protein
MLTFLLIISFTYRCPRTALKVHGHADGETYVPVACTARGTAHLVNPKTGRVLERARK